MRILTFLLLWLPLAVAADPLASWNDGEAKQAIIEFVATVTEPDSPDFVPKAERVAVFDNDGTLWVEQPFYTQLAFVLERLRELTDDHPDWRKEQPFKAALEGDKAALGEAGMEGLMQLLMATHAGLSSSEFADIAADWIATARHSRFERPYTELVYQPMLELLAYLREHGFKTYIVSGGGIAFMRPWTERVYGIPPEQVVGSQIALDYKLVDGEPTLVRKPEIAFIDDKAGKPVGIQRHIGRRPILAFGNSDGDYQMLEWTSAGPGRRLGLILHHDDAEREYAYDRDSHAGRLDKALDDAETQGWTVVSMERDWANVFPAAPQD
ncbi:haloacid dehalogenase [Thiohalocapsa halophila]|uniref:phosphoserine phosphatase n=1 Tax=Thiohalocapsa halophila TaxID=69359 RepID=A0ABS1CKZ0_9GAMM|nr:HAD family hydrolase [Thiohalocapsa halophila]MBK1632586.1 haloacid dehalogenase [Thiohalocapsa halophila]